MNKTLTLSRALPEAFRDNYDTLAMFCYDSVEFQAVYANLTTADKGNLTDLIYRILEHAAEQPTRQTALLRLLWNHNPTIYARYFRPEDLLTAPTSKPKPPPPAPASPKPNLRHLQQRLMAMSDTEFDFFCLAHFPAVSDNMTDNMAKDRKILLLLKHCRGDGYRGLGRVLDEG
ncbi:hypothetical protein QUF64_14685 [Anaerolineales bacterium HSG6]|nr:hypothetical protein [Anaerolineales bacterium HSG6]